MIEESSLGTAVFPKSKSQQSHVGEAASAGLLIINADDWGRTREVTDRIAECSAVSTISSVSAMVFMEDSERAARLAVEQQVDAALHLNFTTSFSASNCSTKLREHQERTAAYLLRRRIAQAVFHPGLTGSFEYLALTQIDEFQRLYGRAPGRLDGHHHMHLCENVLLQALIPAGTIVRRNFTFEPGEKSFWNLTYRKFSDLRLSRRHQLTDFFFSLAPPDPARLRRIYSLAHDSVVEAETHPINPTEHEYLAGGKIFQDLGGVKIAPPFAVAQRLQSKCGVMRAIA